MRYLNFFILISTLFLCSVNVLAVGIGTYNIEKSMIFRPGLEKTYMFYVYDTHSVSASLEGDLAEYATLMDPSPDGNSRNIEVTIRLPEYMEPGLHTLYITATQFFNEAATVGGIASVRTGLTVFALYPGKHPVLQSVEVNDLNVNEKSRIGVNLINDGEETIDAAIGRLTVYDSSDNVIAILTTEPQSVSSYETKTITTILDAAVYNMSVGKYKVIGNLIYDGIDIGYTKEKELIVGSMKVEIIDTTLEVYANSTNKYYISISSDWSGDIENVYAKINLPNGKVVKTPAVDLIKPSQGRKASAEIETYLETEKMNLGTYDIDITLYYKDLTTTKRVKLNVVEGKAPEIEKAKLITPTITLIGISILLIVFIGAYFLVFRRKGSHSSGSSNSRANDEIRPPTL
jgi:hypothetical protein